MFLSLNRLRSRSRIWWLIRFQCNSVEKTQLLIIDKLFPFIWWWLDPCLCFFICLKKGSYQWRSVLTNSWRWPNCPYQLYREILSLCNFSQSFKTEKGISVSQFSIVNCLCCFRLQSVYVKLCGSIYVINGHKMISEYLDQIYLVLKVEWVIIVSPPTLTPNLRPCTGWT